MTLVNIIIYFVTVVTNSLLGFFVYFRNPKDPTNREYIYFTNALVGWIFTLFLYYFLSDSYWVNIIGKINFAVSLLIPFFFYRFVYSFPEKSIKISKKLEIFITILTFFIEIIILFTPLIDKQEIVHGADRSTVFGELYYLYIFGMVINSILSIYILILKLRHARGNVRAQLQYLIFGFALLMITGSTTNIILPYYFNIYDLQPFGPLSSVVLIGFITYAMVRHRLLDIRAVILRSVAYTILIGILATIYTLGVFFFSHYLFVAETASQQRLTSAFLAIFIVLTFEPLKNAVQKTTDSIFFRGKYNSGQLVLELTTITASTFKLKELTQKTLLKLLSTLHIERGTFVVYRKHNRYSILYEGYRTAPFYKKELLDELSALKRMVIVDEEKDRKIKQLMHHLNIVISLPLSEHDRNEGLLLLGEKKSGEIYTPQDIKVIEILGPLASIAIQNAKSYEEIKTFNKTLSDKVATATEELKISHERLQTLDKQKDAFLGMASHELKTPITSIKAFTQVLLKRVEKANLTDYVYILKNVNTQTDRITQLINDLLNVSHIESGKLVLQKSKFDLDQLVNKTIADIQVTTETHMIIKKGKVSGLIYGDENRIEQVLSNLLTNAIKYSPSAKEIIVTLSENKKETSITVQDFGQGIALSDQKKIFERFYRTRENEEKNISGFGLGLYISSEIIRRHKGKIWVTSSLGKGSTFGFTIPHLNKNTK
jgi:signal transduction histidine kinase